MSSGLDNTRGIARIVIPGLNGLAEKHVGMGFLIGPRHLMTCCHVLNDALGRPNRLDPEKPPAETRFSVRFPYAMSAPGTAWVAEWGLARQPAKDVAVLELVDEAPTDAGIAVFSEVEVQREKWFCIGWDENGISRETQGEFATILASEERQLNGPTGVAARIAAGYSGAGVWSEVQKAFVGMVVTKDRDQYENGLAYAIPAKVLKTVWPKLRQMRDGRVFDPSLIEAQANRKAHIIDDDLFVLDRTDLSQHLARLRAKAAQKRVILVHGSPRSGKSHCRYLFELVAREENAQPVYLDRDLMPTVTAAMESLFAALNALDKMPERGNSTGPAWYGTVCRKLREVAAKEKANLWVAVDDLGPGRDGAPLIDPEVAQFFEEFVLQMKNPAFSEPFRLMLIHYPVQDPKKLPAKWDRNVLLQETTREEDVKQEHVIELIKLWLSQHRLKMAEAAIEKSALEILAKATEPLPPGEEVLSRLERIHAELIKSLEDLRRSLR